MHEDPSPDEAPAAGPEPSPLPAGPVGDVGTDALGRMDPASSSWFRAALGEPTAAQSGAWRAIGAGRDTLVIAPTGSGKTLAAFLHALDALMFPGSGAGAAGSAADRPGVSVLYVSPMKALGVDVERNLTAPLVGIRQEAQRQGRSPGRVTVGVRSGDTPPAERRRLVTQPPDVLITTPESLFLMLSSAARETLRTVHTVIVDEVHAVAGTKRGTHLALSLARLDELADQRPLRIGLSATVEPVDAVASFLGGDRPVEVVRPASTKQWDLTIRVPVPDLSAIEPPVDAEDDENVGGTIWPHVERQVLDEIQARRSTLVFVNSRRQAERLTARLNRLHRRRVLHASEEGAEGEGLAGDAETSSVPDVAQAHHGSMSKEHRLRIEDALKAGELRCVVATSSLELGIDMGSVDLVVQTETPPSVASTLQRIGRAGHDVGAVSHGILHPLHAADVLHGAVTLREAVAGRIEPLEIPRNALDVLAQHTVSAALDTALDVEGWFATVRRSAPYASLPRSAFDQVIDLLTGRYPSTAFSELRPRLVLDHDRGTLSARPGAQRLVVTSGGTIPDRGLFPVYVVAGAEDTQPRRVGELDEEMVYESRRGEVITLGTSAWRIEEITHDRVTVSPAFGQAGRIPFWHSDGVGRPPALGRAFGAALRELDGASEDEVARAFSGITLDQNATGAISMFLTEQREATGRVPDDRGLVLERFRDELGDWRLVLHCPLGRRITAPWALAVQERVQQQVGLDGQVMAADDGIVLRLPYGDDVPGLELFVFEPEEIEAEVRRLVGGSALFAGRFREAAARALLLPRRDPNSRSPLWQQRQRAAHLLDVARPFPQFPIMLEAARECMQDVYAMDALRELMGDIAGRRVQLHEVETAQPSPMARSLLLGYMAQFLYDTDAPAAERRSAALALDPTLLQELLGAVPLRELLDGEQIARVHAALQGLDDSHLLHTAEQLADTLRRLGPLSHEEIGERAADGVDAAALVEALLQARRAVAVRIHGDERIALAEDVALLRDALGVVPPPGLSQSLLGPVPDPVGQLLRREAAVRGPFTLEEVTERFGLAPGVAREALERLTVDRVLEAGEFTPGRSGAEWVDVQVLRRIRRASLAAARAEVAPVSPAAHARALILWQGVRTRGADGRMRRGELRGADGVLSVLDQCAGLALPASVWEAQVLASRVADYSPALLDELLAAGEVVWSGAGRLGASDGWLLLHPADALPIGLDVVEVEDAESALESGSLPDRVLRLLRESRGALRQGEVLSALADQGEAVDPPALATALWDLAFAGLITGDGYAGVRTLLGGPAPTRSRTSRRPRSRRGAARLSAAMLRTSESGTGLGTSGLGVGGGGRWSALRAPSVDPAERAAAVANVLLERYGVLTRGSLGPERTPGGFAAVYRLLSAQEEAGTVRRGVFVEGLGAAQFASGEAVDRLRDQDGLEGSSAHDAQIVVLAATDPANPYGASLPWPSLPEGPDGSVLRPSRRAGALVVLVDGAPVLFLDRGGKSLLWWPGEAPPSGDAAGSSTSSGAYGSDRSDAGHPSVPGEPLVRAARALAVAIAEDRFLPLLAVERINGRSISAPEMEAVVTALHDAGAYRSPRALRLRAGDRLSEVHRG